MSNFIFKIVEYKALNLAINWIIYLPIALDFNFRFNFGFHLFSRSIFFLNFSVNSDSNSLIFYYVDLY